MQEVDGTEHFFKILKETPRKHTSLTRSPHFSGKDISIFLCAAATPLCFVRHYYIKIDASRYAATQVDTHGGGAHTLRASYISHQQIMYMQIAALCTAQCSLVPLHQTLM
jgi:hypothetical protein